ncbi:MAG: NADH:ubiquinone reductase (Na(+)-transporting) subunit C [Alistipes sp.]|jgi:Na+-transporting NADH:ubiquinone oxidoreductase subunit C|nr:NADH:ubiquinone reductase (Na(+)-transporting) subunit C [Alistipes sp.]
MKFDKNNNVYIIVYSVVMVVVVAAVLAVAAMYLQPIQQKNMDVETKGALLASVGVVVPTEQIESTYAETITEIAVPVDGGAELKLYESSADGERLFIIPVNGSGLWGPVWGYVAVEGDWNTISGVVFDHKGETPGLGAEIATPKFAGQFVGKKLFEGDAFVGITVLKGAGASAGNDHAVDAISGGTITSRAVETMIRETIALYLPYIERQKAATATDAAAVADPAEAAEDGATLEGATAATTEGATTETNGATAADTSETQTINTDGDATI